MLDEKRKKKYKWFLRGIGALKLVTDTKEQAGVIENFYVAMRYIDDVVDGDVKPPEGYTPIQYVKEKIEFVETDRPPKDDIEKLISLSFRLGTEFGHDYHEDAKDIIGSLLFDAERRGTHTIFDEKTLHDHFYALDIKGTIKGALKVVGENMNLYEVIEPLGEAVRIYYNLRDFRDDIQAGLVNISSEDCERFHITKDTLKSGGYATHMGVHAWFIDQAKKGLALMDEYHKKKEGVTMRPATEATLKLGFERKAKSFMTAVAAGKFEKILGKAA